LQGCDGIVCYVSNNSFVEQIAFDSMRKHLLHDFTHIFHLDLHGNVRQNTKLSGTTHNIFGIQVGVGITVAIRSGQHSTRQLFYHRVPEDWRKGQKLDFLQSKVSISGVDWKLLEPDSRQLWIIPKNADMFRDYLEIGSKNTKKARGLDAKAIFKKYSVGLSTNRDAWVYSFNSTQLQEQVKRFIETYNSEIDRWKRAKKPTNIDAFVTNDEAKLKWSSRLKETFAREVYAEFDEAKIRTCLYRPFSRRYVFFDSILNHRQSVLPEIFPDLVSEQENRIIALSSVGNSKSFQALITNMIADAHLTSDSQCFPFYAYDSDGTNRRENITDWALAQFRAQYADAMISKWDIFYYVYGLLHHPGYREKFADALKRELPRIPYAPEFKAFAEGVSKG